MPLIDPYEQKVGTLIDPYEQNVGTLIDRYEEVKTPVETISGDTTKEQWFMGRVGSDFDTTMESAYKNIYQNKDMTAPEKAIGYAKTGWELGSDVIGQGLRSAYQTIVPKKAQEAIGRGMGYVVDKTGILPIAQEVSTAWQDFAKENPRTANIVGAGGRALEFGTMFAPTKAGSEFVGNVAGKAATRIERVGIRDVKKFVSEQSAQKLADKGITEVNESVLNDVKKEFKKLSSTEQKKLVERNKVETKGILQKEQLKTTAQDIEIAKSAEGLYSPNDHYLVKIDKIDKKIGELAKQTEALPAGSDLAIQTEKVKDYLNAVKADSSIAFVGDATLEKAYDTAIGQFEKLLEGKPRTLKSVLDARKEFDKLMQEKKNVFKEGNVGSVLQQAQKDVRMAANDFIAESLPEGNSFKQLLKEQTNLFNAQKNIALNNVPSVSKGIIPRVIDLAKKHPIITAELTLGAGFGGALLAGATNPIVLSALATYGTYKLGKTILTTKLVRDGLVDVLRGAEKVLSPAEAKSIQKTITYLDNAQKVKSPYTAQPHPYGELNYLTGYTNKIPYSINRPTLRSAKRNNR